MSGIVWDFKGKTALVTGAAGGIGETIVRKLCAGGANVVFSDLKEADGRALERELRDAGAEVRFVVSNATDEEQVKALVGTALSINGKLDIAINNVGGIGHHDSIGLRVHDSTLAAWHSTMDMNLTSCFLGMKHQLAPMMAAKAGSIVNLTSLAALRYSASSSPAYTAAKSAVIRLTEYAATTYAPLGIRVNVVAPGFTATKIVLNAFPDPEVRRQKVAARQPMGRMIEPGEIADACLWASSDAASSVTGLTIPVDGGTSTL